MVVVVGAGLGRREEGEIGGERVYVPVLPVKKRGKRSAVPEYTKVRGSPGPAGPPGIYAYAEARGESF